MRDGVISSKDDPSKRTTFAALVKVNGGAIRQTGRGVAGGERGGSNKGVGACFAEVEVDTWTGNWRFVRATYVHDTGLVINPLVAEADMVGSLIESTQVATDAIPWDREFPGTRHYSVGYLSYRLPTIMDVPEQTQVYIDSLEPRWFYGIKSFSETSIGAVPGAISNAIYNACGVRLREHPITREKIMGWAESETRMATQIFVNLSPKDHQRRRRVQILSSHGNEAGVYAAGHGSAHPAKESAEASAQLSGGHQDHRQSPLHQGRPAGQRENRRSHQAAEIADSDLLKQKYPMLVQAINMISSPELRNASTIGGGHAAGSLVPDICAAAMTVGEMAGTCAMGPSATTVITIPRWAGGCATPCILAIAAVALIPFDATVKLATPVGTKELTVEQLVPGDMLVDGRIQSHVVRFNEILTEVILPPPNPHVRASFEKLRPRGVWDFAMASLALKGPRRSRQHHRRHSRSSLEGSRGSCRAQHAVENSS